MCQAGGALETLVHQFSDPLSFYRELIQNSLDAHSSRVEIGVTYEDGRMLISVADFGEGMSETIIQTRLTRLFASDKQDDLTKIGKFGIGFVSVFAIEPEAVVVDTGREGESWRIVFQPDRSYLLMALSEPIEGTRVRLYKTATAEECADFTRRSRESIRFWCRHVPGQLLFQGEPLNEPFELEDSPCHVRRERKGTTLLVGFGKPFMGLYNAGLTLQEGVPLPGLAVKIDSRYLEHTLTRDGVLQDEMYAELMAEVRTIAATELPEKLAQRLEADPDDERLLQAAVVCWGRPHRRTWRPAELTQAEGEADGADWLLTPERHARGEALSGALLADLPTARYRARVQLFCEECVGGDSATVCSLELWEGPSCLQTRSVLVEELVRARGSLRAEMEFSHTLGQKQELRLRWNGRERLRVRRLEVEGGERLEPRALAARKLFQTPGGRAVSLAEVPGEVFLAPEATPLTQALEQAGVLVLRPGGGLLETLLERTLLPAEQAWCLPVAAPPELERQAEPLCQAVLDLLRRYGARLSEVRLADLGPHRQRLAAVQPKFGALSRVEALDLLPTGLLQKPAVLALNLGHPLVTTLIASAAREPELAACLLARLFMRTGQEQLALQAWEARCQRRA